MIYSTEVISLKVAKFGSMDIVELHGYILHPGGQLETPGLVWLSLVHSKFSFYSNHCSELSTDISSLSTCCLIPAIAL